MKILLILSLVCISFTSFAQVQLRVSRKCTMHIEPTLDSELITRLQVGDTITMIDYNPSFTKIINRDDQIGYIGSIAVKLNSEAYSFIDSLRIAEKNRDRLTIISDAKAAVFVCMALVGPKTKLNLLVATQRML